MLLVNFTEKRYLVHQLAVVTTRQRMDLSGKPAPLDRDSRDLLMRSRDAISKLTKDLIEQQTTNGTLSEANHMLQSQVSQLQQQIARLQQEFLESSQDDGAQFKWQREKGALEGRLASLQNELAVQRSATESALSTAASTKRSQQHAEANAFAAGAESAHLQSQLAESRHEIDSLRDLVSELLSRLKSQDAALLEKDDATTAVTRELAQVSASFETQLAATRQERDAARADASVAAQRIRELESAVAKLDADLVAAKDVISDEQQRGLQSEAAMREALGRWLGAVRSKFSGLTSASAFPDTPNLAASSTQLANGGDDRVLAWLEQLPVVTDWFEQTCASLTAQLDARVQASLAAVDRLEAQLRAHTGRELQAVSSYKSLASQRAEEVDALRSEVSRLSGLCAQLQVELSAAREETAFALREAKASADDAADKQQQLQEQIAVSMQLEEAASLQAAQRADVEDGAHRLQGAWEDRDRILRLEMAAMQRRLGEEQAAHAAGLADVREKLAMTQKRLDHARQYVLPQAVKQAFADEIQQVTELVRVAGHTLKASRSHAERVMTFMRTHSHPTRAAGGVAAGAGGGAIDQANEPYWLSQTREAMDNDVRSSNKLISVVERLVTELANATGRTLASAMEDAGRAAAELSMADHLQLSGNPGTGFNRSASPPQPPSNSATGGSPYSRMSQSAVSLAVNRSSYIAPMQARAVLAPDATVPQPQPALAASTAAGVNPSTSSRRLESGMAQFAQSRIAAPSASASSSASTSSSGDKHDNDRQSDTTTEAASPARAAQDGGSGAWPSAAASAAPGQQQFVLDAATLAKLIQQVGLVTAQQQQQGTASSDGNHVASAQFQQLSPDHRNPADDGDGELTRSQLGDGHQQLHQRVAPPPSSSTAAAAPAASHHQAAEDDVDWRKRRSIAAARHAEMEARMQTLGIATSGGSRVTKQ